MTRAGSATVALGVGGGAALCLALALRLLAPEPGQDQASAPISVQLLAPTLPPPLAEPEPRHDPLPAPTAPPKAPRQPQAPADQAPRPSLPTLSLPLPGLANASLPLPDWPMGEVSALNPGAGENERVEQPAAEPPEPFRWIFGPPHLTAREKERHYPRHALRRGLKGEVELLVRLGPQGRVQEVSVVRSEPSGVFDAAARNLARTWRGSRADLRRATILFEPDNGVW